MVMAAATLLHYGFNCGSGPAWLVSKETVNDGEWHSVVFSRHQMNGKLVVDEVLTAEGISKGATKTMNVIPPYYIGGIDPAVFDNSRVNLKNVNRTFEGCLRNFKMNGRNVEPSQSYGVIPCSKKVEAGAFFSADGGYIKAYERFRVGMEIDIKLDIKPRNVSGLLVSVHSKKDYLVLQMVNGVIKFSVDNGKGEIVASYTPPMSHFFCDGQWHNIQAVKSKNVVTLSVDKVFVEPGIGEAGSSATDTRNQLYIGGHPNPGRLRGIETTQQFVGCLRNVDIKGQRENLSAFHAFGNVTLSVCPTT